jgi:hypothetical protein
MPVPELQRYAQMEMHCGRTEGRRQQGTTPRRAPKKKSQRQRSRGRSHSYLRPGNPLEEIHHVCKAQRAQGEGRRLEGLPSALNTRLTQTAAARRNQERDQPRCHSLPTSGVLPSASTGSKEQLHKVLSLQWASELCQTGVVTRDWPGGEESRLSRRFDFAPAEFSAWNVALSGAEMVWFRLRSRCSSRSPVPEVEVLFFTAILLLSISPQTVTLPVSQF